MQLKMESVIAILCVAFLITLLAVKFGQQRELSKQTVEKQMDPEKCN